MIKEVLILLFQVPVQPIEPPSLDTQYSTIHKVFVFVFVQGYFFYKNHHVSVFAFVDVQCLYFSPSDGSLQLLLFAPTMSLLLDQSVDKDQKSRKWLHSVLLSANWISMRKKVICKVGQLLEPCSMEMCARFERENVFPQA